MLLALPTNIFKQRELLVDTIGNRYLYQKNTAVTGIYTVLLDIRARDEIYYINFVSAKSLLFPVVLYYLNCMECRVCWNNKKCRWG